MLYLKSSFHGKMGSPAGGKVTVQSMAVNELIEIIQFVS
jgi:hypothetical protein